MSDSVERMLPHDINAEAAVLCAMLIDGEAVPKALEILKEEHFYKSAHKTIFRGIISLFDRRTEVDIITLIDELDREGQLERAGGRSYISELSDVVLSSANVVYHAKIVLEKALLRMLINTSGQIIETAYEAGKDAQEILDSAEQSIFEIAESHNVKAFEKLGDMVSNTVETIEDIFAGKSRMFGLGTGFEQLDKLLGGFRKGQFIVLAARPAMGKSSLALNIAYNLAMNFNKKVAIFTMEMPSEEIALRFISSAAEISMDQLMQGYGIDQMKMTRIIQAADGLSSLGIYVDDTGTNTALDIRAKTRRLKAELGGLDLVVIDYIQLMVSNRNRENRQQEIAEISRAMKVLAKELDLPVIALSQLNRGLESRDDKRPLLSDLRESGAIEQDADIVMFIYRDEYYNKIKDTDTSEVRLAKEKMRGKAEIIVGKNRHGRTDTVVLDFHGEYTTFTEPENL
jgi:replicative DNA helicase